MKRVAVVLVVLAACSSAPGKGSTASSAFSPAPVNRPQLSSGANSTSAMPDGEFVGSVGTVAGNGATVTWQVRCGTKASGGPIPTGAFTLQTAAMTVEVESDPSNPAAGHVSEVPLSSWVDIASQGEWTVVVAQNRATQIRSSSAPTDHDPCA